jgi:hypothetical protein
MLDGDWCTREEYEIGRLQWKYKAMMELAKPKDER